MKKLVFGLSLFCVGFLGAVILIAALVCSPQSPWLVNGVEGIYSGMVFMKMQLPVAACILLAVSGLIVAIKEAFFKR